MAPSGELPRAGLFCATYLEPEALHVHRHVNALRAFRAVLLTQKLKGSWPGVRACLVARSPLREVRRWLERRTGRPWQLGSGEARTLAAVLDGSRCRLLHVFAGDAAAHMLPLFARMPQPLLVSFHGADVAGSFATPGYAAARRALFARAALVACRSAALAEAVAALGCPRGKLRTMRAVLDELPAPTVRTPPADGHWRILQAGRLIPKKGCETAIRAFAAFRARFPNAAFCIAGEGPLRSRLAALARELNVPVELPGFLDRGDLRRRMAAAHIYLHPSETADGDCEGIPNALLEAMASGLPPVATRHGGIPEAVEDGVSGLLAAEGDVHGLAAALDRLASGTALYARLASGAHRHIANHFAPAASVQAIEALYREAAQIPLV